MAVKRKPVEQKPFQKTPEQLAQWAAYEALCRQREDEARVRDAARDAATAKRKASVDQLRAAESLLLDATQYARAQQIRAFAASIVERVPSDASDEVKNRANDWGRQMTEIADALDPTNSILASFEAPKPP